MVKNAGHSCTAVPEPRWRHRAENPGPASTERVTFSLLQKTMLKQEMAILLSNALLALGTPEIGATAWRLDQPSAASSTDARYAAPLSAAISSSMSRRNWLSAWSARIQSMRGCGVCAMTRCCAPIIALSSAKARSKSASCCRESSSLASHLGRHPE